MKLSSLDKKAFLEGLLLLSNAVKHPEEPLTNDLQVLKARKRRQKASGGPHGK